MATIKSWQFKKPVERKSVMYFFVSHQNNLERK